MSTKTTNYNMTLPAQEDYYDVDVFNENYEIIDEALKDLNDAHEALAEVATSGSYTDLTDKPTFNSLDYKPFTTVSTAVELKAVLGAMGSSGGVIYLLPGVYDFTGTTLGAIDDNNVTLMGSGAGTVLKFGANNSLSVLGNRCGLKDLTLTREVSSTYPLVLLDSSGDQTSEGFLMDNVYLDCPKANASSGFIGVSAGTVKNARFTGLVIDTDQANSLIYNTNESAAINIFGVVSGCIAGAALTVPSGITTGANMNITVG